MRRALKYALRALLALALIAGGLAIWKREEITRLIAVNSLFSAEKIVHNFSHMDTLFRSRALAHGTGPVSELPAGAPMTLPAGADDWITQRAVTALVVAKDDRIVHESYYLGTGPQDLRISWSVAKSFLSALFGTVVAEGRISSLDAMLVDYAPSLKGTAYDGVTIRQLLNMASGVQFNEDYLDFYSDINRMGRVLALGGSMDGFAASLKTREAPPGSRFHYVSIDTHVLGMVIAGATGRDPADLLSERIITPLGLEAGPYYITDGDGTAFVLGGLNLTSRDYLRFGLMVLHDGAWNGRQIVPADWLRASVVATAPAGAAYGYQWWLPAASQGEVFARGIYGQYIYINQPLGVVIALNSADRNFEDAGVDDEIIAMFRAIAEGL